MAFVVEGNVHKTDTNQVVFAKKTLLPLVWVAQITVGFFCTIRHTVSNGQRAPDR